MIITKTPFRISFFGGGTDIEKHFEKYGGAVISTTIDKYCYVTVRNLPHFFDYSTELSYSKIERVNDVSEIEHPAIRNAMEMTGLDHIRLSYEADLPARSGLGTSSSFSVGMLKAFYALKGWNLSKKKNASAAIYLERILCKESGGWQDQIASCYGGLNRIDFPTDGNYTVKPLDISEKVKKDFENHLLLIFTGISRFSSEIQKENSPEKKTKILLEMNDITNEAEKILTGNGTNLDDIGKLLDDSWNLKRKTGKSISTSLVDEIYETGKSAGAIGGKLLGAGGGGFFLFYVRPEDREKVIQSLSGIIPVPFHFESEGTQILFQLEE